ncbi:hypothetical protein LENED_000830 [Lentinula edodes]|uniref:DUF6534 domain-containing protein n=1 Tax=Lentinula edodes TaxID=5353 RepID=A0A1Q3DWJ0_LENED|nr:hypothetical protein LENED_000830 [Lentinula edodes]
MQRLVQFLINDGPSEFQPYLLLICYLVSYRYLYTIYNAVFQGSAFRKKSRKYTDCWDELTVLYDFCLFPLLGSTMAVPINVDTTLGFLSHAVVLCCILYGAGCMQAWFYYRKYSKRDSWTVQTLVAAVIICDTCQIGFLYAAVYNYTVTNQGNPLALAKLDPNLIIELIFSGMIAFLVQHFYCYRIYALSKSRLLSGFVSLTSLGSLVTLYYFIGVVLSQYTELAQLALLDVRLGFTFYFIKLTYAQNVSIVTNVLGIVSDLAITFLMIFLLQRSKTGFKNTTDVLNRLIVFTFNTGIPTSLCSIVTLILLEGVPGTFIYIFVYVSMGRFYTNCLLVTLNSRDYIRQGLNSDLTSTNENYALSIPNNALESRLEFAGTNSTTDGISIRVDRDIHTSSAKHRRGDSLDLP